MNSPNDPNDEKEGKTNNQGIPFRLFLDKSTNLITVFGILNALFIYSTSIDDTTVKLFLVPSFFLLSLFIWFEIILLSLDCSDNSFRYDIFYFLSATVETGLAWYFVVKFYPILIAVGILGTFFGLTSILIPFLIWLLPKWILRFIKNKSNTKTASFIVVILAILIAWIILLTCLFLFTKVFK